MLSSRVSHVTMKFSPGGGRIAISISINWGLSAGSHSVRLGAASIPRTTARSIFAFMESTKKASTVPIKLARFQIFRRRAARYHSSRPYAARSHPSDGGTDLGDYPAICSQSTGLYSTRWKVVETSAGHRAGECSRHCFVSSKTISKHGSRSVTLGSAWRLMVPWIGFG